MKPAGWNALFAVAIVAIVGAGFFATASPAAASDAAVREANRARGLEKKAVEATGLKTKEIEAGIWNSSQETLAASVLERMTMLAMKHHLQLSAFRTDKASAVAGLLQAPFVATLDGSFADAGDLVSDLERPDSKLAVEMLQVTSSDAAPGKVTATVGLVAYLRGADAKEAK